MRLNFGSVGRMRSVHFQPRLQTPRSLPVRKPEPAFRRPRRRDIHARCGHFCSTTRGRKGAQDEALFPATSPVLHVIRTFASHSMDHYSCESGVARGMVDGWNAEEEEDSDIIEMDIERQESKREVEKF
eukprot:5187099-Pleurochrysis_carterae.AAC.1